MEGKTDSKMSGEMLLQGAETAVDPVDRVSSSCRFVIGERSSVIPYVTKRLNVRFSVTTD